jgi:hypothetical protein
MPDFELELAEAEGYPRAERSRHIRICVYRTGRSQYAQRSIEINRRVRVDGDWLQLKAK